MNPKRISAIHFLICDFTCDFLTLDFLTFVSLTFFAGGIPALPTGGRGYGLVLGGWGLLFSPG